MISARQIREKHGISRKNAIHVAAGRYSLTLAKRQDSLRKREMEKKSVDAFSVGRRLHGSYGSKR